MIPRTRPGRREVEQSFNRFRVALGDPGYLELDHYPASGGYRITDSEGRTPLGSRRRQGKLMIEVMDFAVDAIHLSRGSSR